MIILRKIKKIIIEIVLIGYNFFFLWVKVEFKVLVVIYFKIFFVVRFYLFLFLRVKCLFKNIFSLEGCCN